MTIINLFNDSFDDFQLFYKEDDYLFTHAGVTKDWLNYYVPGLTIDELLNSPTKDIIPKLLIMSEHRGGLDYTGSPIWSDVRELDREETYF